MTLPATNVPREALAEKDDDADVSGERFEDMFPASFLPTFSPIPSRRPRMSESHGMRTRRERASHGR
jgi:hypothetical protein